MGLNCVVVGDQYTDGLGSFAHSICDPFGWVVGWDCDTYSCLDYRMG
jgi:hypothetical protein